MWKVEHEPTEALLLVCLRGSPSQAELVELAQAHDHGISATGGATFRVLLDLRGLRPLVAELVGHLERIKRTAASVPGCARIAVLVDSATVAMQQNRTRVAGPERELVTLDEAEARRFLEEPPRAAG